MGRWFAEASDSGSLERYLETFSHTVAVMQTAPAITRVAREAVEDLIADGVVYAEIRYAPELMVAEGLSLDAVVAAVQAGFDEAAGERIVVRQVLTAMRHQARSREIAELAIAWRDRGVVGFDIAGAEAGYPPTRHLDAFEYLQRENFHFTIHAGEAFGLPSIWEALQWCGADRLGHGVRIVDDITTSPGAQPRLGRLANYVRDKRIPLEMCPSSNVQTGVAPSLAQHPWPVMQALGLRLTLNTDDPGISGITLTGEYAALVEHLDQPEAALRQAIHTAAEASLLPPEGRARLRAQFDGWLAEPAGA